MSKRQSIKRYSKNLLHSNLPLSLTGFTAVALIVSAFFGFYELLYHLPIAGLPRHLIWAIVLIAALFATPVLNGYFRFTMKIAKRQSAEIQDIFYYFSSAKSYLAAFNLNLLYILRAGCVFLLALIPYVLYYIIYKEGYVRINPTVHGIINTVLPVILFIGAAIVLIRYVFVYFLFEENNGQKLNSYFKQSAYIVNKTGFYQKIIKFSLSFIPWFLLCFFVIPVFYVIPYYVLFICVLGTNQLMAFTPGAPPPVTAPAAHDTEFTA